MKVRLCPVVEQSFTTGLCAVGAQLSTPTSVGVMSNFYYGVKPPSLLDDFIDEAVLERLLGVHKIVAVSVFFNLFQRLSGMLC